MDCAWPLPGDQIGRFERGALMFAMMMRNPTQIMFLLTDMWCGIVLLALLGYTLNWLFLKFEDRVLGWHRGARGRTATS